MTRKSALKIWRWLIRDTSGIFSDRLDEAADHLPRGEKASEICENHFLSSNIQYRESSSPRGVS